MTVPRDADLKQKMNFYKLVRNGTNKVYETMWCLTVTKQIIWIIRLSEKRKLMHASVLQHQPSDVIVEKAALLSNLPHTYSYTSVSSQSRTAAPSWRQLVGDVHNGHIWVQGDKWTACVYPPLISPLSHSELNATPPSSPTSASTDTPPPTPTSSHILQAPTTSHEITLWQHCTSCMSSRRNKHSHLSFSILD